MFVLSLGDFAVPQRSNNNVDLPSRSGASSSALGHQPPTPPHTPKMIVGINPSNGCTKREFSNNHGKKLQKKKKNSYKKEWK